LLDELLFPAELQVHIDQVERNEQAITIRIGSNRNTAVCPGCGQESRRIHSVYRRSPKDLPIVGYAVQLYAGVRRYFCDNAACEQRTFAEQFPGFLAPKSQRTQRLISQHEAIAFALGGEAGQQLCARSGMSISADTLIRAIRRTPDPAVATPRVLGIDDWAKRKGQDYGTILVDLETRQPVDVLESRTVEAVSEWLKAHPGVEKVSRDRGSEYVKGVSEGAPDAEPIADRWHLLSNLRETLVTLLEKKPAALKAAAQITPVESAQESLPDNGAATTTVEENQQRPASTPETQAPGEILSLAQQEKATRRARRQARFEQVHASYATLGSIPEVARQLHMSRRAAKRYLNTEECPQYPEGSSRHSKLTPYLKTLQDRWQAGCTNASQLWREIRKEGFTGSRGLVARWAAQERKRLPGPIRYRRQQEATFQALPLPTSPVIPWSAKRASWLIVKKPPDLTDEEKEALDRMIQADSQVALGVDLAKQFATIVRHRQENKLDSWLELVRTSGLSSLLSFANRLQKDLTAVRNALRYAWSQGQTEGQVNRLKFIKRSM
jgi:transposase